MGVVASPEACFCPQSIGVAARWCWLRIRRPIFHWAQSSVALLQTLRPGGIHRPGEGTSLRKGMVMTLPRCVSAALDQAAIGELLWAMNVVWSRSIRCSTTASLRASATLALRMPARRAIARAQVFRSEPLTGWRRITFAAS